MARDQLTGTRIRERRVTLGIKQSTLASDAGISASYLNLIEHNRRRIGGKLLVEIARLLDVEPAVLAEGAEAQLVSDLRAAAQDLDVVAIMPTAKTPPAETDRTVEFAGRFPGWAALTVAQAQQLAKLEHTVAALTERLTHDPQLASALHEVLSTATAIRSTATILVEDRDISPEWLARFHRNINEEAARLSESSTELVRYLEAEADTGPLTPHDEVERFMASQGHRIASIEEGEAPEAVVSTAQGMSSQTARDFLLRYLKRYARDARRLPLKDLEAFLCDLGPEPDAISARADVPLDTVLHRLTHCSGQEALGLVLTDASGTVYYRKPINSFSLPQGGPATMLWPVFAVLSSPGQPLRRRVSQVGRRDLEFDCFAAAAPSGPVGFDAPPRLEATALIRAAPTTSDGADVWPVALV